MCKLVVGIKKAGKNQQFNELIYAQEVGLKSQPDGIGAVTVSKDGTVEVFREFKDYNAVFEKVYERLNDSVFVSIHTRIGTSGNKDITNVHFFEDKNYLFAHNGFVSMYHQAQWNLGSSSSHNPHSWNKIDRDDYDGYGYISNGYDYDHGHWDEEKREWVNPKTVIINDIEEPIGEGSVPLDEKKFLAEKNYINASDVLENCYACCYSLKLCQKHLDVTLYLKDDTQDFFRAVLIEKEKIMATKDKEKISKMTPTSMIKVAEYLVALREKEGRGQPLLLEGVKKLSKKERKAQKRKWAEENTSPFCDSFQFLKNIKKPVTKEIIESEVERTKFSGMGIIINKVTLEASLMCFKPCKGVTDGTSFGMFFSYDPEMEFDEERDIETEVCGVPMIGEVKDEFKINLPVFDVVEGVHELKRSKISNDT